MVNITEEKADVDEENVVGFIVDELRSSRSARIIFSRS